jgi:hypothetical protein
MSAKGVVYEIRRGRDGLPRVVQLQTQKCPETEAPGQSLSLNHGCHPAGGKDVVHATSNYARVEARRP